jgi:SAM-dependent methyltransferase
VPPVRGFPQLERRFWSLHSRTWDRMLDDEVVAHLEDLVALLDASAPPGIVLDAGCGTGNHSIALSARGRRVVAIDFASGMLGRARAKAPTLPVVRADLRRPLPLRDSSVSGALSSLSMQFLEPADFLGEVARVLAARGVALVEWPIGGARPRRPPRDAPLSVRAMQRAKMLSVVVGVRVGVAAWHTPDDVRNAAIAVGLEVVDLRTTPRRGLLLARKA